jgi:hypothetical protein
MQNRICLKFVFIIVMLIIVNMICFQEFINFNTVRKLKLALYNLYIT